jgi:hypothetical protein
MLAAFVALATLPSFTIKEVTFPLEAVVSTSRQQAYGATRSVRYDLGHVLSSATVVDRTGFNETKPTPLLNRKITDAWWNELKEFPGEGRIFGNLHIVQDRYLVTSRFSGTKDSELKRTFEVVDLNSSQVRSYSGFENRICRYVNPVPAVGPDWILVNVVPQGKPSEMFTETGLRSMVLVKDGRETELGKGYAAGMDEKGRLYATENLDAKGQPALWNSSIDNYNIKVYENNRWRSLGSGIIRSMTPDGTLFVEREVPDTGTWLYFTVKDNVWTLVERPVDPAESFVDRGLDGTMLFSKVNEKPTTHSEYFVVKNGVTTPLADALPDKFQIWPVPTMTADGTILVQGKVARVEKSFLIRVN